VTLLLFNVASLREEKIVDQLHGQAARRRSKKKVSRNGATTQRKSSSLAW
jgi:hypothetical protein